MKELEKSYIMKDVGKPQYYLEGDMVESRNGTRMGPT
jgi:hypothetical protein